MYSCKVKASNKNGTLCAGLLFAAAILLLAASMLGLGYRSVLQGLMLVFLVAALLVTERYCLASYEYILEDTVGDYDLVVLRTSGRHTRVQCRMALSAAGALTRVGPGDPRPAVTGRLYDYTATLLPARCCYLPFPGEQATLRLEPDEAFAAALASLLRASQDPEQ